MVNTRQIRAHASRIHRGASVHWMCQKCKGVWTAIKSIAAHYRHCTGSITSESGLYPLDSKHPCPECDRAFSTLGGLQLHRRRRHPSAYNESLPRPTGRNRPWGDDELRRLASAEIEFGKPVNINQRLHDVFEHRTVQAISTIRKSARYRCILAKVVEDRQGAEVESDRQNEARASDSDDSLNLAVENLMKRVAELESDSSSTVRAVLAYARKSLADGDADSGIELLPPEICSPVAPRRRTCVRGTQKSRNTLAPTPPAASRRRTRVRREPQNRDQRRRQHYKLVQNLYKSNKRLAAGVILDDQTVRPVYPPIEKIDEVFRGRFSRPSPPDNADFTVCPGEEMSMSYLTPAEIQAARSSMKKDNAPGPDRNATMDTVLSLELPALEILFNVWFVLGQVPVVYKKARTILLPKSGDLSDPNNWRPITICSIFGRLYAKLLANRLSHCAALCERQKAFLPVDGCGENTVILSAVLANAHKARRPTHLAFLDLAKAFDTVPHTSIIRALRRRCLPEHFIKIVANLYTNATTSISTGLESTEELPIRSGVKQGCPLSPMLFNLVLDELIRGIGTNNGIALGDSKVAIMAFADDLILLSGSADGLQANLQVCEKFFADRSMAINARKSMSLSIVRAHGRKTMMTDEGCQWTVGGERLAAIRHTDDIKYLGVQYTAIGRSVAKFPKLEEWLRRLKAAPLKPQQRVDFVRSTISSRLIHLLRLCRVTAKMLNALDRRIRTFVKGVLHLPPGTSTDFFYLPIEKGGLGLREFRSLIPAAKLKLIGSMKGSSDPVVVEAVGHEHWLREERWCERMVSLTGMKDETLRRRVERYISSHTGQTQSGFTLLPGQSRWLERGRGLSGREYVVGCHLMSNTLPVRTRTFYGGPDRITTCRYCHNVPETTSHALQSCPKVRDAVTKRHNTILSMLRRFLTPNHDAVIREPWFRGPAGNMNPDLVVKQGRMVYVVDLTVPYDSSIGFMDGQASRKVDKYAVLVDLIKEKYQAERVEILGLAIGARGLLTQRGWSVTQKLGLSHKQTSCLAMTALKQTCGIWGLFQDR